LNLDRVTVILHTVMHHSSTSSYVSNFIAIEETFCGRTDGHFSVHVIRWTRRIFVIFWVLLFSREWDVFKSCCPDYVSRATDLTCM